MSFLTLLDSLKAEACRVPVRRWLRSPSSPRSIARRLAVEPLEDR